MPEAEVVILVPFCAMHLKDRNSCSLCEKSSVLERTTSLSL